MHRHGCLEVTIKKKISTGAVHSLFPLHHAKHNTKTCFYCLSLTLSNESEIGSTSVASEKYFNLFFFSYKIYQFAKA
jgi:hypothetical protein